MCVFMFKKIKMYLLIRCRYCLDYYLTVCFKDFLFATLAQLLINHAPYGDS